VHNFYVPAGGDEPDPAINVKFAHKLAFSTSCTAWRSCAGRERARDSGRRPQRGAARARRLEPQAAAQCRLAHPVETEKLTAFQKAGNWVDVARD
jgi:exodeoxyribonuclease-3